MEKELSYIYSKLPEPFKSVMGKSYTVSIDYKTIGDDHKWLNKHGYEAKMLSDCSYSVKNNKTGKFLDFNASSYGNWGTCFKFFDSEGFTEEFGLLLQMLDEGVIELWRIRMHINDDGRRISDYMYFDGVWMISCKNGYQVCESPLIR